MAEGSKCVLVARVVKGRLARLPSEGVSLRRRFRVRDGIFGGRRIGAQDSDARALHP